MVLVFAVLDVSSFLLILDEPNNELDDSSNEQNADDNCDIDHGLNDVLPSRNQVSAS